MPRSRGRARPQPTRRAPARGRAGPAGRARQPAPGRRSRRGTSPGWRLLAVLAVVVVIAAIGAGFLVTRGSSSNSSVQATATTAAVSASCAADDRMDTYSADTPSGISHTDAPGYTGPLRPFDNPTYTMNPPSGGDHLSTPVGAGDFGDGDVPRDGNLVHSLEHGYVILWHRPDVASGQLQGLKSAADHYRRDVLVVSRPSLQQPIAATAWHHRLLCTGLDQGALLAFVARYRNQGPERIPH